MPREDGRGIGRPMRTSTQSVQPDARALVTALGGRWYGTYGTAICPAHDDRQPSLSICEANDGKLLIHCHAGCEQSRVIAALRAGGLWEERSGAWTRRVRPITVRRSECHEDRQRIEAALRLWGATQPATGTEVETYLRQARGVLTGMIPADIRYAPSLRHPGGGAYPAMVCAVRRPDGVIGGIHRTWLRPDGTGKAEVTPAKAMLGRCAGGAVRLAAAGDTVLVAEGVETALAVFAATRVPTWAALSTSGIRSLLLPAEVRRVTICADGDDAGEAAAQAAAQRWLSEGNRVQIARPPRGSDFNDVLLGRVPGFTDSAA